MPFRVGIKDESKPRRGAWGRGAAVLFGALALLIAAACSDSNDPNAPRAVSAQERERQRTLLLDQRLAELQERAAQIDKQLADLRLDQDRRVQQLADLSQALSSEIQQAKRELTTGIALSPNTPPVPPVSATGAPVVVQNPPGAPVVVTPVETASQRSGGGQTFLRLVLILIILLAIWFIYKLFMGRWAGVEDDDIDDDPATESGAYHTDMGTVRITPEAEAQAESAAGAASVVTEESDADPLSAAEERIDHKEADEIRPPDNH